MTARDPARLERAARLLCARREIDPEKPSIDHAHELGPDVPSWRNRAYEIARIVDIIECWEAAQ